MSQQQMKPLAPVAGPPQGGRDTLGGSAGVSAVGGPS